MTIMRTARFTLPSDRVPELLERRAALIDAVRAGFPGLTQARLARVDEQTWVDVWRWESAELMQAALAGAPGLPQAGPAFALIPDLTAEVADVVDER